MLSGTSGPCPVSLACVVACLQTWGGVGPSTFLLGVSSLVVTTSSLVVSIDDHSLSMHAPTLSVFRGLWWAAMQARTLPVHDTGGSTIPH